jgi:CheY-like chemotaxis protein
MGFKEICSDLKDKKFLLVEDADYILNLMKTTFEKINHNISIAKDGKEAIEIFDKESPDIVITDIRMPLIGGEELIRHIKDKKPDTIAIAVTAFIDEIEDQELPDAIYTKPLNVIKLIDKVHELSTK